jgi:coenzyme Q-binding protein COQ10
MIRRSESRVLPYPADLLYRVTADVEAYPEFLPWCRDLRVLERTGSPEGEVLLAEMTVGVGTLTGRYISRVALNPIARTIDVTQAHGPFRHLDNRWRFAEVAAGTQVDFSIAFEIANPLMQLAVAGAFETALARLSAAFARRAETIAKTGSKPSRPSVAPQASRC